MASFNKVMLMGNLTRDPELRYTPNGQAVCDLGLAVSRKYSVNGQDKEDVCFVSVVVWAKQAESCGKYLHKGSPVFVEGRLQYESWDDKDGTKRSRLRVTAERVQFLYSSPKGDQQPSNNTEGYNNNYSRGNYQQPAYQNGGQNKQNNAPQQYSGGNTNQRFQQNQPVNRPIAQNEPMPPPPPEVFDNEEPEDDIPF